jgi:hypothetical protein
MNDSDHAAGWDGVERRAGEKNPRRVAVVFSGDVSRKERSEPHVKRLSYPNNLLNVPQTNCSSSSVAEI